MNLSSEELTDLRNPSKLDMACSTISSFVGRKQMMQNNSTPPTEGKTSLTVLVNTRAVLSCPPVPLTPEFVATWKIIFRDNTSCTKAYRRDKNETLEANCTNKGITWATRPDQNPDLQINPVAITHDGSYMCEMVTSNGNFHHCYHVQVLVPPEVTVFLTENRTVVCKAVAGKPAAQISWNPEGDCVTEQENQGNGAVSVQSTCHWEDGNMSTVTCSVSHLARNESLSIQLHPGGRTSEIQIILYTTLPILIILIIILSIYFLKTTGCRKYKLTGRETIHVFEEDEMQPYASYTEKNNPLYDTTTKVKTSQVLQNEVSGMDLHTL
ncbi:cell surface glycoprotein CD200 receptor 1-like [Orycteropus afer afer]|uniref:Cell surface glycoprotein CD200 receptor 1-like n=1 Tax=Orycteropus afer afer TaxID=1230840 RepID=A0AC54ZC32_ORYAF|nr:cell surface glycoprotein CD200 receptor 1-like [Orycteropus afer afer]